MTQEIPELWNKFSLTAEEKDENVVKGKDIKETMEKGQHCLVGKVIADNKINRQALKNTMFKIWKFCIGTKIIEVGENLYIFEFQSETELNRIWEGQS